MARKRPPRTAPEITFPFRVIVPVASYRKFPDPIQPGLYHHTGYIPALCYPDTGFPNDANLRPANIDRQIYRQIAESLNNVDCTPNLYHLKSKGELHVATQVRELGVEESRRWFENNVYPYMVGGTAFDEFERKYKLIEVLYDRENSTATAEAADDSGADPVQASEVVTGIIDGGHTDQIWKDPDNRDSIRASYTSPDAKKNLNHLPVEWLVGVKPEWLPEIVIGRNTGMHVREVTLANYAGKFQWLKDLFAPKTYGDLIAYRENEPRAAKPIDIRDVIALLAPFNRDLYSLQDEPGKKLPLSVFTSRKAVLDDYIADMEQAQTYVKLTPIVPEILELHDLIHLEAVPAYNKKTGGRGTRLNFVDHRESEREHPFLFIRRKGPDRLADGAMYPILGAFSALVTTGPDGRFAWRTPGGFEGVKKLWRAVAGSFMEATADLNKQLGYNPAAVGKSAYHWKNLYRDVAFQALS
jgi:hypothetical protein